MERNFRSQPPRNNGCRRKQGRTNTADRRQRIRKYDAAATRELITKYGHIVKFIAHKLSYNLPASMEVTDLINVGLVCLLDAAERFEVSLAFTFTSFAQFRVRGAKLDEMRRQDWIPRGARERTREYKTVKEKFSQEKGRRPTNKEVGKK